MAERHMGPWAERVLLERLAGGDETALADLYERYAAFVYTLAMRTLVNQQAAEDVTQDVFVYLWQHPERIEPGRGTLRGFLGTLTHRRSVDTVRRDEARRRREARVGREYASMPDVAEAVVPLGPVRHGPHGSRGVARIAAARTGARLRRRLHLSAGCRCVGDTRGHGQVAAPRGVGTHRRLPRFRDERARRAMDMNDDSSIPPMSPDDLATYALDALDAEDAVAIAAHLDASPDVARREQDLRSRGRRVRRRGGQRRHATPPAAVPRARRGTEAPTTNRRGGRRLSDRGPSRRGGAVRSCCSAT